MTPESSKETREAVTELLGDLSSLAEQIGSPGLDAVATTPAGPQFDKVRDREGLIRFIDDYRAQILAAIELPAIVSAHSHAVRSEYRDLIALDQRLSREPLLAPFAESSRRIGRTQLKRLRPLRDQRTIQRYLAAIEDRSAHGWHMVAFGLILGVYSLPLRQGLLHYADLSVRGFVMAGAKTARLTEAESERVVLSVTHALPAAVEAALGETVRFGAVK